MKLYVSRHGIRLDKVQKFEKSDYRKINPPLVSYGYHDLMSKNKEMLDTASFDYIFSSPFLRCIQTANFYSGSKFVPILIENGIGELLREKWFKHNPIDFLYSPEEMKKHYHNIELNYVQFTKGYEYPEGRGEAKKRTHLFVDFLLKSDKYKDKSVLLVGHGFSIKDVACYFNKYDLIGNSLPEMGKLFYLGDY